jgi:hypothetical protein
MTSREQPGCMCAARSETPFDQEDRATIYNAAWGPFVATDPCHIRVTDCRNTNWKKTPC